MQYQKCKILIHKIIGFKYLSTAFTFALHSKFQRKKQTISRSRKHLLPKQNDTTRFKFQQQNTNNFLISKTRIKSTLTPIQPIPTHKHPTPQNHTYLPTTTKMFIITASIGEILAPVYPARAFDNLENKQTVRLTRA